MPGIDGEETCPCGNPVPRGLRKYCSVGCRTRLRLRKEHPLGPRRLDAGGDHGKAAAVVASWMRLNINGAHRAEGDSIWCGERRLFVVRHTSLAFTGNGAGLPEYILFDDVPQFEANDPEPEHGYLLLNGRCSAAVNIPTNPVNRQTWRRARYWLPYRGGWDEVLSAPKGTTKAFWLTERVAL